MSDPYRGTCDPPRRDAEDLPVPEGVSIHEQIIEGVRVATGDVSLIHAPLRLIVEEMPIELQWRYATTLPCYFRGIPMVDGDIVKIT